MWTLTIEDEEGARTRIPLTRDAYFVGRENDNEICLSERNISRKHAQIRRETEGWVVEDLDSYNGTYINGARVVGEGKLADGDILQMGDYRLEFADEVETTVQTPPEAVDPAAQRPARLVVVVGPTVGQEFPLGDAKLTVGRAEDADLIIQHASISRLHAEIVPLGDGHYEVIDSQSANGIRINGVDLKRGILEAGDALELGDVRLRFVAKGKVFRLNADQSQQLAAFNIEALPAAELSHVPSIRAPAARASSKTMLLGLGIGAVCLVGVLAIVLRAPTNTGASATAASTDAPSSEATDAIIAEARDLADKGDLEGAHAKIASLGEAATRDPSKVSDIEAKWADSVFAKVENAKDPADKRQLLLSVATTETVDAATRKRAIDQVTELDAETAKAAAAAAQQRTSDGGLYDDPTSASTSSKTKPASTATTKPAGGVSDSSSYAAQRRALEPKVWSGKASEQEIRLLRAICTHMGDTTCRNRASAMLAAKK